MSRPFKRGQGLRDHTEAVSGNALCRRHMQLSTCMASKFAVFLFKTLLITSSGRLFCCEKAAEDGNTELAPTHYYQSVFVDVAA